jgi:hypothetical protein
VTWNDSSSCSDTNFCSNGVHSLRFSTKKLLMPYFHSGTSLAVISYKDECEGDRLKGSVV